MQTSHKIIIGGLVLVGLLVVARYTIFEEQWNDWVYEVESVSDWEADYRKENPNATDSEVDHAFYTGVTNIKLWKEKYKQDNPDATDAQADAAFEAAWNH